MADISSSTKSVDYVTFRQMAGYVYLYKLFYGKDTDKLPIGNDYMTKARYDDMEKRCVAYVKAHGIPKTITINKSGVPKRVVGTIQKQLESFLGQFNSFSEYYNKIIGRGYGHYNNDVKTLAQEITALKNKTGLNCSDAVQLSANLAIEMGYKVAYEHVICSSGEGHIRLKIDGKEFGDHGSDARNWKSVDTAAALSVGSKYSIGKCWCENGKVISLIKPDGQFIGQNDKWLITDDGSTTN